MATMAAELIYDHYANMKANFPSENHKLWECSPLPELNLDYAAVDGYVSYELYRKIQRIEMGLQPQPKYCPGCLAKVERSTTKRRSSSYWDDDGRWKEVGDGSDWNVNHDDSGHRK